MNITYDESIFLALYLEFFNRCYDPSDARKYEVGPGLFVRHIEMQNIGYLLESLWITFEYGYTWDWKGPYSPKLQVVLNGLDKKEKEIADFYDKYNEKRKMFCNTYEQQLNNTLSDYLNPPVIQKIAMAAYVLENILKQEQGSEYLAGIIYIGKTILPGGDLSQIMPVLYKKGYHPSPSLTEEIWKDLAIIGIREKDTKGFTRERKLISNNDGRIC